MFAATASLRYGDRALASRPERCLRARPPQPFAHFLRTIDIEREPRRREMHYGKTIPLDSLRNARRCRCRIRKASRSARAY